MLDNSDGKQARKIQASSPLGLMFDHGCDMLNTGLATITICKIFALGSNWYFFAALVGIVSQFFYATLEEYFVGGLFLPLINGVNEGLFLIIGICLFTFFVGSDFWRKQTILSGVNNNTIFFYVLVVSAVFTVLMK